MRSTASVAIGDWCAFIRSKKLRLMWLLSRALDKAHYLESVVIWSDRWMALLHREIESTSLSQVQIRLTSFEGRRGALVTGAKIGLRLTLNRIVSKMRRARPVSFGDCW
jgi:hypothetical protein